MGFECLNGFPGPFIKFMAGKNSPDDIYNLCTSSKKFKATIQCAYALTGGYLNDEIKVFEGSIDGSVVKPRGATEFKCSLGLFFQPAGLNKTYSEMSVEDENPTNYHAAAAFEELKKYLETLY